MLVDLTGLAIHMVRRGRVNDELLVVLMSFSGLTGLEHIVRNGRTGCARFLITGCTSGLSGLDHIVRAGRTGVRVPSLIMGCTSDLSGRDHIVRAGRIGVRFPKGLHRAVPLVEHPPCASNRSRKPPVLLRTGKIFLRSRSHRTGLTTEAVLRNRCS